MLRGVRDQVLAYLFELGCVTHSLIIGIMLGVEQEDEDAVSHILVCTHACIHAEPRHLGYMSILLTRVS